MYTLSLSPVDDNETCTTSPKRQRETTPINEDVESNTVKRQRSSSQMTNHATFDYLNLLSQINYQDQAELYEDTTEIEEIFPVIGTNVKMVESKNYQDSEYDLKYEEIEEEETSSTINFGDDTNTLHSSDYAYNSLPLPSSEDILVEFGERNGGISTDYAGISTNYGRYTDMRKMSWPAQDDSEDKLQNAGVTMFSKADLTREALVGSGGFSVVYSGTVIKESKPCAIKQFKCSTLFRSFMDEALILREIVVAKQRAKRSFLDNVVTMFGVTTQPTLSIVTNLVVGGNLASKVWTVKESVQVSIQILRSLQQLHSIGIIHKDLTSQNILFEAGTNKIYITDFGISKLVPKTDIYQQPFTRETCIQFQPSSGAHHPRYAAPELWLLERFNHKVDIFSFGLVLYQLLCSSAPFPNCDDNDFKLKLKRETMLDFSKLDAIENVDVATCLKNIIQSCLRYNPVDRSSIVELEFKLSSLLNE